MKSFFSALARELLLIRLPVSNYKTEFGGETVRQSPFSWFATAASAVSRNFSGVTLGQLISPEGRE